VSSLPSGAILVSVRILPAEQRQLNRRVFLLLRATSNFAKYTEHISVGTATGYGWVRLPAEARDLSPFHSVQTGSGAHPASYPMGTGGSFPEG
jgi:hypothetical protein